MTWTPERVEEFRKHFDDGMSFSLIAAEMNMSRNALIGYAHRKGWPRRKSTKTAPRIGARARSKFKYKSPPPPRLKIVRPPEPPREAGMDGSLPGLPVAPPVIVSTEHFCLLENLEPHSCRFPCWEDSALVHEKFFCGEPTANIYESRPYCSHHAGMAFGPSPQRKPHSRSGAFSERAA